MKRELLFVWFICLSPFLLRAQDPTFTQVNSVPIYYNPAFAGSISQTRLAFNYRNQWPNRPDHATTFSASYDQYSRKLRGGVGGQFYYDHHGLFKKINAAIVYSPKYKVGENWGLSPAVKVGLQTTVLDTGLLTGSPGIDLAFEQFPHYQPELAIGFLANTRKFYIGISADHLLPGGIFPIRYIFHTGFTFRKNEESIFSISPSLYIMQQGTFGPYIMATTTIRYDWLFVGFGIINGPVVPLQVGAEIKGFRFGYSYLLNFSPSGESANGGHEASIRYQFNWKKK